jgi:xylulokinase
VVERCATLCGSYDYITGRLTGGRSLEANWAAESGLYDIRERAWIREYLGQAGIEPGLLPAVRVPTEIVGQVNGAAAEATGLRAGTPVIAGSADHVAAALAAGLTAPGDVLLKFGGAGDILAVVERDEPDEHFYFDYHDVPGLALINGCMASSGSLLRWFARELAGETPLEDLDREAARIPAGAGGIVALPYALGEKTPIFDPEARAVFAGVMLHHTRAHMYRAVLEAVCYGFAHHLDLLRSAGRPIQRVLAADGGSRSALWMQIAADVLGEPVQVVSGDAASATGVAFVAGMSVGVFADWNDVQRFAVNGSQYLPEPLAVERYRDGYGVYRELYERLRTLFPLMRSLDAPL